MNMTTPTDQAPTIIPTPGVAPAIPEVPAPAPAVPEAPPAAEPVVEVFKHDETGNPAIDVALEFIGSRGISPADPAVIAAREGNFAPIEEKLKSLGAKATGYEKHLALVKQTYEREKAEADAKTAAVQKLVNEAVGGPERWAAVAAWAGQEATPEQRTQINAALAAGGLAAQAVAAKLAGMYDKAVGKMPAPAAKGNAAPDPTATTPLTAREYAKAVDALAAKARGRDISRLPEYIALQAQRRAARAAGVR
jgi:hypothetical protein